MIKARAYLIFFFLITAFFVLVGKLYTIQVKQHDKYVLTALKQQLKSKNVKAERGEIFDRNGELLAYTKNEVSFYVDNRMSKKRVPDSLIALKFSKVFGKSYNHYMKLLRSGKKQVCLEEKVSKKYVKQLGDFVVDRLYHIEDNTRIYPYGSLASHVLGYVNNKLTGVNGIERQLNDELKGRDGKLIYERDARGKMMGVNEKISKPPVNGKSVVLTIDKNYQKILDEELLNGYKKFGGESAVGIIIDPNNGEILALSNIPNFDPANYNLFKDDNRRNRAISDTYEPGSTIKSIFLAALIEENLARTDEVINTENGKYRIRGAWIRDTHAFDRLTVREVFEHSSNIGIVKLSDRINSNTFYKYFRDFGFGNETHINLPGEVRGRLKKPSEFTKITKPFISHGYEIAVTPLQLTLAYAALVNGGVLYKPRIIKEIVDRRGKTVRKFEPKKIRRVISQKTSETMIDLMEGVVENGTGIPAQLTNIRVGGKTGTSHRFINGSYSNSEYNASFIGFFPVEHPELVCFIWVQSPKRGKYGAQVAAPIFRRVAERIVKSDIRFAKYKQQINRTAGREDKYAINLNLQRNDYSLHSNPGEKKEIIKKTESVKRFTMPNLINAPLRKALSIISATGLKIDVKGSGRVVWQSIPPGRKLKSGDILEIRCAR